MSQFTKDLICTVAALVKVILAIILKTRGILMIGLGKLVLIILAAIFVPLGGSLVFAVLKIWNLIPLGWPWIALTLILDYAMWPAFRDGLRGGWQ